MLDIKFNVNNGEAAFPIVIWTEVVLVLPPVERIVHEIRIAISTELRAPIVAETWRSITDLTGYFGGVINNWVRGIVFQVEQFIEVQDARILFSSIIIESPRATRAIEQLLEDSHLQRKLSARLKEKRLSQANEPEPWFPKFVGAENKINIDYSTN